MANVDRSLPDCPGEASLRLLEGARALNKQALARLVTLFEDRRPDVAGERHAIIQHLVSSPRNASIIGFTGTPGAGKSTLIAELCKRLLDARTDLTIAVLAVDPSSHISGGAILGDRTRMRIDRNAERLYYRSQASNLELGGVTRSTFQATRVLRHFFDLIFIETVGIGQNEIDIQHIADHTCLVMQPLAGDQIQFMKCGIMEIPDSFVINKCDEDALAKRSYFLLRAALKQARLVEVSATDDLSNASAERIFMTSALKQIGLEPLVEHVLALPAGAPGLKDDFYLERDIRRRFGEFGARVMAGCKSQWVSGLTYEQKDRDTTRAIEALIPRGSGLAG